MDDLMQQGTRPAGGAREDVAVQQTPFFEEVDLREVIRKIWRRKGLIFSTVIFLTVLSIVIVFQITPRYSTKALVLIEPRQTNVVNLEAVLSGLSSDAETIQSQIEVLKSRQLIEKVIDKLKLDRMPEFNETLRPPSFVAEYLNPQKYIPEEWLKAVSGGRDGEILSEEDLRNLERVQLVDNVLEELKISQKGRSRVIVVNFSSESPKTAARVANTLADLYIVEQLEAKFEATRRATNWLNDRVSELRAKVQSAEKAVEVYRKKAGLLAGRAGSLTAQQTSELNTQVILAQAATAEAEARRQQVKIMIASPGGAESAAEVLDSSLIGRLRDQEVQAIRKAAELSEEYGKRHPKMINARAELRDIKIKIKLEVKKFYKSLENEVGIARAREASLRRSLERLKRRVGVSNRAEVRLRALQREATANRVLLETFLARFKETSAQEDQGGQQADARIISMAAVRALPSFPKKRLIISLVFVGATFLGVLLAFVVEQLDKGFRSGEQIEQATGVSVLGLVPLLSGLSKIGTSPENYILDHPTSAFGEAIRTLHTSLLVSDVDEPPKTILVTSALPQEGKTTVALCLVRMLALAGHRVVAVDVDLRRPSFDRIKGIQTEPGLVELLSGEAEIGDVLQKDEASGAYIISAGRSPQNPPDLVGSNNMKKFLKGLSRNYDFVILDSPPILAVSDARVLSNEVDATIFVVWWADTKREVVVQGLKQILSAGGKLAGVVLSRVNAKKHSKYGYGDSGYYYGRIKKYYVG